MKKIKTIYSKFFPETPIKYNQTEMIYRILKPHVKKCGSDLKYIEKDNKIEFVGDLKSKIKEIAESIAKDHFVFSRED